MQSHLRSIQLEMQTRQGVGCLNHTLRAFVASWFKFPGSESPEIYNRNTVAASPTISPETRIAMDPIALILGTAFTLVGAVIILICIPLTRGRIPRNSFFGVRLPTSLRSDAAWYAINRFGGRRLIAWSVPVILLGTLAFFLPLQPHPRLALTLAGVQVLFVLIPVVETLRYARRFKNRA